MYEYCHVDVWDLGYVKIFSIFYDNYVSHQFWSKIAEIRIIIRNYQTLTQMVIYKQAVNGTKKVANSRKRKHTS